MLRLVCRYHLEIIKSLAAMCSEVFVGGGVQYGFTTIPTYPRCACTCDVGIWVPGSQLWQSAVRLRHHLHPAPGLIKTQATLCQSTQQCMYVYLTMPPSGILLPCSGQIGFMVCTKAAGDGSAPPNAAEPRQPLPGTPEGRGYTPLR